MLSTNIYLYPTLFGNILVTEVLFDGEIKKIDLFLLTETKTEGVRGTEHFNEYSFPVLAIFDASTPSTRLQSCINMQRHVYERSAEFANKPTIDKKDVPQIITRQIERLARYWRGWEGLCSQIEVQR